MNRPVIEREPSSGLCYGCRHGDHCHGTGDLEPTPGLWPGFICTCECRIKTNKQL